MRFRILWKLPRNFIATFINVFFLSFQRVPDRQVQERDVHHEHGRRRHLLHRGRVRSRRGHRQRALRLLIRSLLHV